MSTETISQVATSTQTTESLPTLDQIATSLENPTDPQLDPQNPDPSKDPDPQPDANKWAQLSEAERNVFREKEKVRKEKLALEKQKKEQDNKFGDLENKLNDYLGTDPENQPGQEDFDPVKYKEELRAEIMKEVKGFQEEAQEKIKETEATKEFKTKVSAYLETNNENFPLSSSLAQADAVYEVITQQFQKDIEEFGQEYASDNMLTTEEAAKKVEQHLASEVGKMLQSNSMRKYLSSELEKLNTDDNDPESVTNQLIQGNESPKNPTTLTNNLSQTKTADSFINQELMTDDEAFEAALKLIP